MTLKSTALLHRATRFVLEFEPDLPAQPSSIRDEFHIIDGAVTSFIDSIPALENASDFLKQRSPESTRLLLAYLKTQALAASVALNNVSPENGTSRGKFLSGLGKVMEIVYELNDGDFTWMIPLALAWATTAKVLNSEITRLKIGSHTTSALEEMEAHRVKLVQVIRALTPKVELLDILLDQIEMISGD